MPCHCPLSFLPPMIPSTGYTPQHIIGDMACNLKLEVRPSRSTETVQSSPTDEDGRALQSLPHMCFARVGPPAALDSAFAHRAATAEGNRVSGTFAPATPCSRCFAARGDRDKLTTRHEERFTQTCVLAGLPAGSHSAVGGGAMTPAALSAAAASGNRAGRVVLLDLQTAPETFRDTLSSARTQRARESGAHEAVNAAGIRFSSAPPAKRRLGSVTSSIA
jgi:hypothetical protein